MSNFFTDEHEINDWTYKICHLDNYFADNKYAYMALAENSKTKQSLAGDVWRDYDNAKEQIRDLKTRTLKTPEVWDTEEIGE